MNDEELRRVLDAHYKWVCGFGGERANLSGADLSGADLSGANLYKADLSWADLSWADLSGANLSGAQNVPPLMRIFVPPEVGSFIAWKKIGEYIIKLQIPEDAKRSSATTRKCRASAAFVLEIQNLDGSESGVSEIVHAAYGHNTVYKVGATTYPDKWDDDRWNECSHGIHFFIMRQEAVDY